MKTPTRQEALNYLSGAEKRNPGPWIAHSRHVAEAAEAIAARHPRMEPEAAYILGCLHDIGRQDKERGIRHILTGYRFFRARGYEDAARICLTHSFPIKDASASASPWDGTEEEFRFLEDYLARTDYDDYDRLVQLCDALALPTGFCLIEKRLVDVALRYGFNGLTLPKWKATFELQREFEAAIGRSIYSVLPGVVENTFGFSPGR
ncbi:MAG: HD domain-containing protein [Armatimonadetes bacterium]|nr:HD domain-containing protein [Armatimonadota bacterium]